jgi:cell division protein FtsZ
MDTTSPTTSQPASRTTPLKVVGIGGAGVNVVEHLIAARLNGMAFAVVNTDGQSLAASSATEKLRLETKVLRGLGSAGDPDRGRSMAEEQLPRIKALCSGVETMIIVAGFGGGAGTGVAPILSRAARESGATVMAFVVLPFDCEGSLRALAAQVGVERMKEACDLLFCFPNQKAMGLIKEGASLKETFSVANQLLVDSIRAAGVALSSQTLMGAPFADLCTSIRQRSANFSFAAAEVSGPNRAGHAAERLLAHPIVNGPASLAQSQALAVCLIGGANLTMVEVNGVMEQLSRACHGVPLMMGAATHQDAGDALIVALLAAHSDDAMALPTSQEETTRTAPGPRPGAADLGAHLLDQSSGSSNRPHSRFVPPPPELTPEKIAQLRAQQAATPGRKKIQKLRQTQLPLEIVSKGRFDQSEPTIHKGEDLDVPTYIRRGISLN